MAPIFGLKKDLILFFCISEVHSDSTELNQEKGDINVSYCVAELDSVLQNNVTPAVLCKLVYFWGRY